MGIVFVEVMDRQGQVKQQIPVTQLPVTIGRAYSNGIVIDDPFICPVHARIESDGEGEIVIIDTESKNGIQNKGITKDTFKVSRRSGLTVKLGSTTIRLRTPEFVSKAAKTHYSNTSRLQNVIDNKPYISLLIVLPLSWMFLSLYLSTTDNFFDSGPIIYLAVLLSIVFWCAGWALLNRILSLRFNFLFHLMLVCSTVFVFDIGITSISCLSFLLQIGSFFEVLAGGIVALFAGLLLFGHLSILGNIGLRIRLLFSGSSIVLICIFYLIIFFENQREFSPDISFNYRLKSLHESLIPTISPAEFFNGTEDLIEKLKKE